MKKFINTTSIITFAVTLLIDAAVAWLAYFAVEKVMEKVSFVSVIFLCALIIAVFVVIKMTIDLFKVGVEFNDEDFVFNAFDCDNTFKYNEVKQISIEKDEKISFVKNFTDRYGYMSLEMNDGKIHTITLGLISMRKLKAIKEQIEMRMKK